MECPPPSLGLVKYSQIQRLPDVVGPVLSRNLHIIEEVLDHDIGVVLGADLGFDLVEVTRRRVIRVVVHDFGRGLKYYC